MRTRLDPTTLASVGTVAKMTSGEGVPGNDVALIRIDPAVAAKWGVNPAVPVSAARTASTPAAATSCGWASSPRTRGGAASAPPR